MYADFLQAKIREKAECWNDLDTNSQDVLLKKNVIFLGRKYSLSSLQDMLNKEKFEEIVNKSEMSDFLTKLLKDEECDFGHHRIPDHLPYYIHRKLTRKRKLNGAIFKHDCSDIFVFEGIQEHHLSILAGHQLSETSSRIRIHNKITKRFVLLEHPKDFNEIKKIAKHPMHRIKIKSKELPNFSNKDSAKEFYWESSTGCCEIIRIFLCNKEVEEIEESYFVNDDMRTFNNRPIAICSSPGMGKSVFLANLAREMEKKYPDRFILFLELRSLIPKLSSIGQETDSKNIEQILFYSESISNISKEILREFLNNKEMIFEVFMDGFDEIPLKYMQEIQDFIKTIIVFPNIRLYITSRPHMKNEIENTLGVISYNIAPFNQENQVSFLCDYWIRNREIELDEKLSKFASTVLESLEFINESMTPRTEFLGIPLQCFILAQVYANDAEMNCNRNDFPFEANISLCKLYKEFMDLKFENPRIQECDKNLIKMYHWMEALQLLFPSNTEASQIVQELVKKVGTGVISRETIAKFGILEQASDKFTFVHRTFAEYFLAEYIAEELVINQAVDDNISVKFIIESVLYVYKTTSGHMASSELY